MVATISPPSGKRTVRPIRARPGSDPLADEMGLNLILLVASEPEPEYGGIKSHQQFLSLGGRPPPPGLVEQELGFAGLAAQRRRGRLEGPVQSASGDGIDPP